MFTNKKKKEKEIRRQPTLITQSSSFSYVEAYKTLRTNLIYAADAMDSKSKVLLVTSSIAGEGKSSVSINLAIALAQAGKRVILIDCDLRKKSLYSYLRASRQQIGLSDYLQDEENANMKVLHSYRDLGIDVMFAGSTPPNPSELLGSARMSALLRLLANQYDFVICDTPPLGIVSDALALGRFVDGAILIASYDQVIRQDLISSKEQLESSNIPILGTVLNMYDEKDAVQSGRKGYGYGSDYYSYYGYGDYETISESGEQHSESGHRRSVDRHQRSDSEHRRSDTAHRRPVSGKSSSGRQRPRTGDSQ